MISNRWSRVTLYWNEGRVYKIKIRRKGKLSCKQKHTFYWREYFKDYSGYITSYRRHARNMNRKLRKKQFYPQEYQYYQAEPKWWRKEFHVIPFRAANKRYCHKMLVLADDYHPYEGLAEPVWNKPHLYYW